MRKMPLNQIAFGKTDAFNELNTFGQEYFMESFVANPKYHIDDLNFVFLGRTALDLLGRMVIHTPLRNYFSVQYER